MATLSRTLGAVDHHMIRLRLHAYGHRPILHRCATDTERFRRGDAPLGGLGGISGDIEQAVYTPRLIYACRASTTTFPRSRAEPFGGQDSGRRAEVESAAVNLGFRGCPRRPLRVRRGLESPRKTRSNVSDADGGGLLTGGCRFESSPRSHLVSSCFARC